MSDNRLKGLALLTGLGLAAVVVVGAITGSDAAATDLQAKAEKALATAGLGSVKVDFTGREAEVSDATPADLRRAAAIVEGVDGVRWAHVDRSGARVTPTARPTTPTLRLRRVSGAVRISGTVPTADDAAELKARAAETFGVPVLGDLMIDPKVGTADWLATLPDALVDIVGVKDFVLEIRGDDELGISGTIESTVGADKADRALQKALPGLDVVNGIEVRSGGLAPRDAATLNATTLTFATGSSTLSVANEAALDRVADVLTRYDDIAVEAGGHAGPNDPDKGRQLSDARVAEVKAYLVAHGASARRVSTRSYGSDAKTDVDPTAPAYRRVDFTVKER